jgi:energy-coupling factor transport system permease protein
MRTAQRSRTGSGEGPPGGIEAQAPVPLAPGSTTSRPESLTHPLAWIAWATGAGLVAFSTTNPLYLLLVCAVAWLVHSARHDGGSRRHSFRVFLLAGAAALTIRTALVLFGTVDLSNVAYAALEGARLATILVVFGAFNSVADPSSVVRLAPRRFHEPALAAGLALSIAPRTVAAIRRVRDAQASRGIRIGGWRTFAALAVPVLETGMEEAVTLAESMDARGHGRGRRSRYRRFAWNGWSVAIGVASGIAAGAFLWAGSAGIGDLYPSTFPIEVPRLSWGLVGAICLLALPAVTPTRGRGR